MGGDFAKGAKLIREVRVGDRRAEERLQLRIAYAARSRDANAIHEYQAAVKLKPSFAAAHYRLDSGVRLEPDTRKQPQSELDLYERPRKPSPR